MSVTTRHDGRISAVSMMKEDRNGIHPAAEALTAKVKGFGAKVLNAITGGDSIANPVERKFLDITV